MLKALTDRLLRRPALFVGIALLTAVPMSWYSAQLFGDVRADLKELLPGTARSVVTLRELERRFGGWSQLSIIVQSPDSAANRRFSDDLVAALEGHEQVRSIRNKLGDERAFFEAKRHLFVELEDLEVIEERIAETARRARVKANPLLVDLEDEGPGTLDFSDIEKKYSNDLDLARRFPDSYFESADKTELAVIIRQRGFSFGIEQNKKLVALVEGTVRQLDPAAYHPSLVVGLGGDVKNMIEETTSLVEDLILASGVVFVLLAVVVLLYFRRFRALLLMTVPLSVGCLWTFGLSHFIIGYLNASSAFLGPIVAGNGINFGLILMARYFEERRHGQSPEASVHTAVGFTAKATSTAAIAASVAYGSLMVTDFLGFSHFGVIGGIGMVLSWVATFLVLPPLIILMERRWPHDPAKDRLRSLGAGRLAALPAKLVLAAPKAIAFSGAAVAAAAVVVTVLFLDDPFEKDFERLRNTATHVHGAAYWEAKVDNIFGRYLQPQVILLDREEDVAPVVEHLKRTIESSGDRGPLSDVSSLQGMVPPDQEEKIAVLKRIRRLLSDDVLDNLDEEQRAQALQHRPPEDLTPFTVADLPESVRVDFRELDGREGLAVLALPNLKLNLYHADEIRRVAEVLRAVPLPDGRTVESSGNFVIYTDMLDAVSADGPKATLFSFGGVILLCILAYRRVRRLPFVLAPLLLGVAWWFAGLALFDWKINFLNFIAVPITFGIGVDYAVNVYGRYLTERRGRDAGPAVARALSSTGGAVALCSLTTMIGYGSLLLARNGALISFGKVSILSEITCLAAAILVMPAWIATWDKKEQGEAPSDDEAAPPSDLRA